VAANAVSATPALGEYDDLVTERLRLVLLEGAAGAAAVRALFDQLADDVDAARELEEHAVALL
jgi:hypothetical protein